jgi:hypothetical protein
MGSDTMTGALMRRTGVIVSRTEVTTSESTVIDTVGAPTVVAEIE